MVAVENAPATNAAEAAAPAGKPAVAAKAPAEGDTSLEATPASLPIVVARDAKAAIAFYVAAMGASVAAQHTAANGKIMHARLKIPLGHSFDIAVEEDGCVPELVETANVAVAAQDVTQASAVYLYVTVGKGEVDGVVERMRENGAVVTMDSKDLEYGARVGKLLDPFGVAWSIASPLKTDVAPAEEEDAVGPPKETEAPKPEEEKGDEKPAIAEEKKATETSAKVDAAGDAAAPEAAKAEEKADEKPDTTAEKKAEDKPAATDEIVPMEQEKKEE